METSLIANRERRNSGAERSRPDDDARQTVQVMASRASRPPDYHAESLAFVALAREMAESPTLVLQKLAELVIDLCRADSAGISVLDKDETGAEIFKWPAVAGAWTPYVGGAMPRDASPCGVVIDLDASLLFLEPASRFPAAGLPRPLIGELLLAPFHIRDQPVGTVWAINHDPQKKFDAEDLRLLTSVAAFASLRIFEPPTRSFAPKITREVALVALASLTGRQHQILDCILQGQPNKIIAAHLDISQRTVENHRAKIMRKMGASSVSALVQVALSG